MSSAVDASPWRQDVLGFARAHIPPAPSRILDVGCGDGWLTRRLAAAGHTVTGIDPEAPDGPLFERAGLAELSASGPFDAVVAILSLHHIPDLEWALGRVGAVLRTGGVLVAVEFAWDRLDDSTVRWCLERLPPELDEHDWLHRRCAELRERARNGRPLRAYDHFRCWGEEEGFHSSARMLEGIGRRFDVHLLAWAPYLYPGLGHVSRDEEQAAIDSGQIQPIGFRLAGTPRPGRA